MRLLSAKMTQARAEADGDGDGEAEEDADAEARDRHRREGETEEAELSSGTPQPAPPAPPAQTQPPAPAVIPRGLSASSERYWRRVLARGETIDWDEERAAQERALRAAGAGGEEAGLVGFL